MVARRARVVECRRNVGSDVPPVLPAIVVDGAERMQRCQRAVYEACERVELGGLTCEEVTIEVGSKSMHGPRTHLHSAIRKPDGDGADLCVLPGAVFPAVDER